MTSSFRNYCVDTPTSRANTGSNTNSTTLIDYSGQCSNNRNNVHHHHNNKQTNDNYLKDNHHHHSSNNNSRNVKKKLEKFSKILEEQLQKLQFTFSSSPMKLILDDETLHEIRAYHLAQLRDKLKSSLVNIGKRSTATTSKGDEIYESDNCDAHFESIVEQISALNLLATSSGEEKEQQQEPAEQALLTELKKKKKIVEELPNPPTDETLNELDTVDNDNEDDEDDDDNEDNEDNEEDDEDQELQDSVKIDKTTIEIGGCGDEDVCCLVEGSTDDGFNDDQLVDKCHDTSPSFSPSSPSSSALLISPSLEPVNVKCSCSYNWQFWFWKSDQRFPKWDYGLQKLSKPFNSLERLQFIFDQLIDIHEIVIPSDYSLFRESIKPKWEDSANKDGGSWTIEFERNSTDVAVIQKIWIGLLKFVISDRHWNSEICGRISGLKISMRFKSYQISLWTLNFADLHNILKIGISIHRLIESIIGKSVSSNSNHSASISTTTSNDSLSPVSSSSSTSSVISWSKEQQQQQLNWDLYYRAHKVAQQNALIKEQTKFGYGQFYGQWL